MHNKIRIAVDGIFFSLNKTGITVLWEALISSTSRLYPNIEIYWIQRGASAPIPNGITHVIRLGEVNLETAEDYPRLSSMLDDSIDCNAFDFFISTYYTVTKNCRNIGILYDFIPENFPNEFNLHEPIWKLKEYYVNYNQVFALISHNTKHDLLRFYPHKSDSRLFVIPLSGQPLANIPTKDSPMADLPRKYIFIPAFSLISKYKNHATGINAAIKVASAFNISIVVSGNKDDLYTEYADHIGRLICYVDCQRSDVRSFVYAKASLVLYPSLYEGFGLPIAESIHHGTPFLAHHHHSLYEAAEAQCNFCDMRSEAQIQAACLDILGDDRPSLPKSMLNQLYSNYSSLQSWDHCARVLINNILQIHDEHRIQSVSQSFL